MNSVSRVRVIVTGRRSLIKIKTHPSQTSQKTFQMSQNFSPCDPVVLEKDRSTRLGCPQLPQPRSWVHDAHHLLRSRDPAVSFSAAAGEMEAAMQSIIKANIERFKLLLSTEADPTKRAMEIRLLAEEEEKLAKMPKPENKEG
jgi:hypothetical protein